MPAKAAGRQDEMAPALPTIPPRIGTGVRVKTRKKPCRAGTIVEAVGNREWKVKFDGKDVVDEEIFSSQKLQINQEAYGHHQEGTPPPSPSRNISQTSKPTGKKAPRELRDRGSGQVSYKDNGSDKKTTPTPNRFEDPQGVFICENNGCKLKHWREVLDLQSSAQTQTNSTT
mmetsp:Transcript_30304/g.70940  ORF Transcript_30304/g.70940 Transcript_30304/m.70940 type:complete len:172 (+) Transcript_30304:124-639(+)